MGVQLEIKLFCFLFHCFFLGLIFLSSEEAFSEDSIEMSFLNTKEGDAIFLESNSNNILIDAGPPVIQQSIFDKVSGRQISVIITHPHPDHYGGIFYLQGIAEIKEIFDNGESLSRMHEGSEYAAWYSQLIRGQVNYGVLRKGKVPFSDENFQIEVLWPSSISDERDYNANSLVLLVTIFKKKILLMGDATKSVEKIMLKEKTVPKNVDVLKVGHHGAEDAASEEFLEFVSPRYSVITGSGNSRHEYEHSDTMNRLKKYSDRVFVTHHSGTIVYTVNSNGKDYIESK